MATVAKRAVDDPGASFSGKLLLRMPKALHARLARAAERRGTSLNQLIVTTLTDSLADEPGLERSPAAAADAAAPSRAPRLLNVALAVNLAVVILAGAVATALLIAAWRAGF